MKSLKQQVEYYQKNPANCLNEFILQPASLSGLEFDGHGFTGSYPDGLLETPNIVFKLNCSCGGITHIVIAESITKKIFYIKSLVVADKYYLKCTSCEKKSLLFIPSQHGYNAEVSRMEGLIEDESTTKKFGTIESVFCKCLNCKKHILDIYVRLEYPIDLFDEPAFTESEQEFFSWFTVVGVCPNCSALSIVVDFECA